jgi:hypothetical protein
MAVQIPGFSDEQKQEWTKRCTDDPAFRDALIVETYASVQGLLGVAAQVAAMVGPALDNPLFKSLMGGNGKK